MTILGAAVLFLVIWVLAVLVSLQLGVRTQAEERDVTPGTPASAPADAKLTRKFLLATLVALVIWALISALIISGAVTLDDIDFFKSFRPSH